MTTQFYTVKKGDTLSRIAKHHHTTTSELGKLNGLRDVNKLEVGQRLALTREAVCKVEFQFLDRDHNPLKRAKVRLEYCGKLKETTTGDNGRVSPVITDTPSDTVKVWIERAEGGWKEITQITSDWGNKLVTLVSPKIKIQASTRAHPQQTNGKPVKEQLAPANTKKARAKNEFPLESKASGKIQSTFGDEKGIKTEEGKSAQGLPLLRVTNDQPHFEFLEEFNGETLTDADFDWGARELGVEEAILRAINEVEAAGKGFASLKGRLVPKILYERHYFHDLTKGVYSADNPDISYPVGYYQQHVRYLPATRTVLDQQGNPRLLSYWRPLKKRERGRSLPFRTGAQLLAAGEATTERDLYANLSGSYKRLVKAYSLDSEAALQSCSWGSFQIMGRWFSTMGYPNAHAFAKAMSRSEKEQMRALILYAKKVNPGLVNIMKEKDFDALAAAFNGTSYMQNKYHIKLRNSYEKWLKR